MQTIRTGIYGLLKVGEKFLVIKKGRGPFTGKYDLPGGKIEHGEEHKAALQREITEETGLNTSQFTIKKLISIEEDFVQHVWKGEQKDEHVIAIIYLVDVNAENLSLNFVEDGGDAMGLYLLDQDDSRVQKTNILEKALKLYKDV